MREAHGASEVSSLAVVPGQPRVVSGAHDGGVKLWNFATGQCLKRFTSPADHPNGAEVTGLMPLEIDGSRYLLSVGWSGALSVWTDQAASRAAGLAVQPGLGAPCVERFRALEEHTSDGLCLAENGEGLLASGDCDGVVVVWDMDLACHNPASLANSIAPRRRLRLPETLADASTGPPTPADILYGLTARACALSTAAPSGDGVGTAGKGASEGEESGAGAPSPSPPPRRPSGRMPLRSRRPSASCGAYHGVEKVLFMRQIKTRPLVVAYSDGTVAAWSVASGDLLLRSVSGHDDREAIVGLLTDAENRFLISASAGGVVCVRSTGALVEVVARGRKSLAMHFSLAARAAAAGTGATPVSRGLAAAVGLGSLGKQERVMLPRAPSELETILVWRSSQGVIASAEYVDKWALLLLAPGATTCWSALCLYTLRGEPVASFGATEPGAAVLDVAGKLDAIRRAREGAPPAGEVGEHSLLAPPHKGEPRMSSNDTVTPAADASGSSVRSRTCAAAAGKPEAQNLVTAQHDAGRTRAYAAESVAARAGVGAPSARAEEESGAGSRAHSPGREEVGQAHERLDAMLEGYGLGAHDYSRLLSEHAEELDSHLLRASAQKAASAAEREAGQDGETLAQDGEARQWLQRMTVRGDTGAEYSRAELALRAASRSDIAAAAALALESPDAATAEGLLRNELIVPAQTTAVHGHLLVRALRDAPRVEKPDERRVRLYGTVGGRGRATATRAAAPGLAPAPPGVLIRSRSWVAKHREATPRGSSGLALLGAAKKLEDALNHMERNLVDRNRMDRKRMDRSAAPTLRRTGTRTSMASGGGGTHSVAPWNRPTSSMLAMKRSSSSPVIQLKPFSG